MNEKPWYQKLLNVVVAFTLSFSSVIVFIPAEPVAASGPIGITPITWDVVGLDSNRPLTQGPQYFPVGTEVCNNSGAARDFTVELVWDDPDTTYINERLNSLTTLNFSSVPDGTCFDAYFEIELTRDPAAFGESRAYHIVASYEDGATTVQATTPEGRQIYIERLVSQNRNTTLQIRYCNPEAPGNTCDPDDPNTGWIILGGGGSINLAVGGRYYIELMTQTSTAYEEVQSFLTLSNTIFQVLSVETTYTTLTAPPERIPQPNPQLWGDGCLWDSDPASPNYNSCLSTGKAGGVVTMLYEIRIIRGGGESVGLEALIYDRSGGSFHYNTDYSQSPGELVVVDPTDAGFSKRFIPSSIGADGTATLRFTIVNPNPVPVSGYNFTDVLPGDMVVDDPVNASSTCGGTVTATVRAGTVAFAGGALGPNSTCTILVNVTVPYSATQAYPLTLTNTAELYVGDDPTGAIAEATLEVTEETPPPLVCDFDMIARWTFPSSNNNPQAPNPALALVGASAVAGAGLIGSGGLDFSAPYWRSNINPASPTLAQAITNNMYFEFVLDTTGIDEINLAFFVSQQPNGPEMVAVLYGETAASLTTAGTFSIAPTDQEYNVTLDSALNLSGNTLVRFYIYQASGTANAHRGRISNVRFEADICRPAGPGDPVPDPPMLSKTFDPTEVRVGEEATLTFTITNPNAADALTGITFRDELPGGMTAITNTFVNNGCGGTWGYENNDPGILLFTGGELAADTSCTLSVTVVATSVGQNLNLSDPIDAIETLPGNSAQDTLTVLPPPALPSIVKFFDANPLLELTGTSILTFRVTNNDPDLPIAEVAFTDVLPEVDDVQMVPVDPLNSGDNSACGGAYNFTWDGGTNTLSFSNGEIAAGGVCEVWIEVEVPGVDVSDGPVQFPNQTSPVSHVFEGITYEGNDASATLLVDDPIPGIVIFKQVGPGNAPDGPWFDYLAVEVGDQVYYKLTVENIGETMLSNISVADPVFDPPAFDPSLLAGCPWNTSGFTLPVADFSDPEAHIAVCIVGPVEVTEAGVLLNTATASADEIDEDVEDSATYATAELTMTKTADPTIYFAVGDVITYTFTVTNTGDATLTGPITITDNLIPATAITCPPLNTIGDNDNFFDPGETIVCEATYTITDADVTAGRVTNIAFASTGGFDSPEDDATVILAEPALTVSKALTAQSADPIVVGTVLTYTITATNTGNITLHNVVVSDMLLTPDSNTCASVAVGDTCVLVGTYTVTQADVDAGQIVNTGSAVSDETPTPEEDTVTTPLEQTPALTLEKSASPATYSAVGDVITYTFTVTNTGNVTLYDVSIADPLVSDLTPASVAELAPGATAIFTATYTITQDDLDVGSVFNSATANASDPNDEPVSDEDTETVEAVQTPALTLDKSASPATYSTVGDVIVYTFTVTNTGNVTLYDVSIADPLVSDLTPASVAELAPGATATFTATYSITQDDLNAGSVVNSATANASDPNDDSVSDEDTETVEAVQTPALTLEKSASPATYSAVGDVITYTFTVTNTGNVTLYDVSIADSLVSDLTPDFVAELAPGATAIFTATYTITQADLDEGNVYNSATANAIAPNESPVDDTDDETVDAEQEPVLDLSKTALYPTTALTAGDVITYTFVATNTGNVTLTDVEITDPLDGLSALTCAPEQPVNLAPGDTLECSATYTITPADVDAGSVYNLATVTGTSPQDEPVTDTDDATVPPDQAPSLTLYKTAEPQTYSVAGEVLTYTFVVENDGNVAITNVVVSDPLFAVSFGPVTLGPGASVTFTYAYTVTQADVDAGSIYNVATANGVGPHNAPLEATDDETVEAVQNPALTLEKTASPATYSAVGDVITYTFTVMNTGNVTLYDVSITDPLVSDLTPASVAELSPGATATFTGTYTIMQDDLDAGSVFNSATANATDPNDETVDDTDTETVTAEVVPLNPGMVIEKTVLAAVSVPYMPFTYTIAITNTGDVTLTNLTVTDTLPGPGFYYVAGSGQPAEPQIDMPLLVWENLGPLNPGETLTVSLVVTVSPGITIGVYLNEAFVAAEHPGGVITGTDDVPVSIQDPVIAITKQVADYDLDFLSPNYVTYTFAITNVGVSAIDFLPVYDLYDANYLHFAYAFPVMPDTVDNVNGQIAWQDMTTSAPYGFGFNLLPGESFHVTTVFTVVQAIDQPVTNTVMVSDALDVYTNPAAPGEDSAVIEEQIPTAVTLRDFRAMAEADGIRVAWTTTVELDNFGFRLLRATEPDVTRASDIAFIPSACRGNLCGASYGYLDTGVSPDRTYWYWLVDVDTSGIETLHGPVAGRVAGAALTYRIFLPIAMRNR